MSDITNISVSAGNVVPVDTLGGQATIRVNSGGPVYYADNAQVSSAHNQGNITAGNSVTFSAPQFITAAAGVQASVTLTLFAGSSTAPAGAQDVVLGSDGLIGGPGGTGLTAGAQGLTPTAVKTSAYAAAAGDFVPVNISGGSVTVTLPTAPADRTRIGLKVVVVSGSPGSTALTVASGGSDVFNVAAGSTSLTLTALFQDVLLQYKASSAIWYVTATDAPLNVALGAAKLGTDGTVGGASGSALTSSAAIVSSQLGASNSTDDTATINAALAAGGRVRGKPGQTYLISSPLLVPSNTELDMTNCTVAYASGISAVFNMLRNSKVAPATTATDVSTAAGSAVVTSATLAAVAQAGQQLAVVAAGPPGGNQAQSFSAGNIWLYGSVLSVSGNNITLTSGNVNGIAAHSTLSGATGYLFNRDSNITIIGGTWDGGTAYALGGNLGAGRNADWTSFNSHQLRLRRVDGLTVRNLTVKLSSFPQGGGWVYGVGLADCTDFLVENCEGSGSSTVVQGDGPLARGEIRTIRGQTQDDQVALGCVSFQGNDTEGDITGVTVDGIYPNASWTAFKAFAGSGSNGVARVCQASVRKVRGTTVLSPVNTSDYAGAGTGPVQVQFEDITAAGPVSVQTITNAASLGVVKNPTTPFQPEEAGLLASSCDPGDAGGSLALGTGFIYLAKVWCPYTIVVTNLLLWVKTAGATLTTGQSLAGIYDPQGNMGTAGGLIAKTADQASAWTSTGRQAMALTAQGGYTLMLPGGPGVFYWVGVLSVGTTPPVFAAKVSNTTFQPGQGNPYATTVPGAKHRAGYDNVGSRTSLVSLNGHGVSDAGLLSLLWAGIT